MYLTTKNAATYLDCSIDFLKKNKGKIFKEGIHYTRPRDAKLVRWLKPALDAWITGKSSQDEPILTSLIKSL